MDDLSRVQEEISQLEAEEACDIRVIMQASGRLSTIAGQLVGLRRLAISLAARQPEGQLELPARPDQLLPLDMGLRQSDAPLATPAPGDVREFTLMALRGNTSPAGMTAEIIANAIRAAAKIQVSQFEVGMVLEALVHDGTVVQLSSGRYYLATLNG